MLRILSWIAIGLGALALIVGLATLAGARDWRGDWLLLPTIFGINALVAGVLTMLLGAIGLGTAHAAEEAGAAVARINQAAFELRRLIEDQKIADVLDGVEARVTAAHDRHVAKSVVDAMSRAVREGGRLSEEAAVSRALQALGRKPK